MAAVPQAPAPTFSSNGSDGSTWTFGAWETAYTAAGLVAAVASGYHGYKRNGGSAGWGLVWGILGFAVPVVTVPVALLEGFATPSDEVRLRRLEYVARQAGLLPAASEGGFVGALFNRVDVVRARRQPRGHRRRRARPPR